MNGKLQQKNISKAFPINRTIAIEMLIPFVLGMAAIIAHARIRMHLGIPGHQGLIFMSLLLIARKTSNIKWSSLIFSTGVCSMLYIPFLGFNDPFVALVYLWPGIVFDLFYVSKPEKQSVTWYIALIGGLSYTTIPISRFLLGITTGIMHKSVMTGLSIPFISFFVFGLLGALTGFGSTILIKRFFK